MLKRSLLALMLAGLLYTVTPLVVAQDSNTSGPPSPPAGAPPEGGHGRHHFDPAKRTRMLSKHLKLTSDQRAKVEDILKAEQSQMQQLHQDSSDSQPDRRSKMMDLHKSSNDQIRAVLDADQQKKWDEMQSKREQRMREHHHGQARGSAPASSEQK